MDDRFVESQPPLPTTPPWQHHESSNHSQSFYPPLPSNEDNNQQDYYPPPPPPTDGHSCHDHQYGYGGYYSPFPPLDHHQHSQKEQHRELQQENRHSYGADRPYQSNIGLGVVPLGQNSNSPSPDAGHGDYAYKNDESAIDEAAHDGNGQYRYQHIAGQAEAFSYDGNKGSQDATCKYASFQQVPGEDGSHLEDDARKQGFSHHPHAKKEDAISPVENNIRDDGKGCDKASFQQVQVEDRAYHRDDARKQGFPQDDPAFCPPPYESREDAIPAVENNISTYDYASFQQEQGEDGAYHQDDSRKEGFSQNHASGSLYPPYANKQAGAQDDGAYHQDDVRRQGFSQDDASGSLYPPYANQQAASQDDGAYHQDDVRRHGFSQDDAAGSLYPPYANQQAASQTVDNDVRDARREREGIGGWISEVQQQEALTAKEERQGIGGWISDNHDTAVAEQEKHYERIRSGFKGVGSRDENENKEDFFTPLRPATSGVREDDRTEGSSYTDNQATVSQGEASTGRRRRSRWEPQADGEGETQDSAESAIKKRRSRWSAEEPKPAFQLPDFVKQLTGGVDLDPELQSLNIKLLEINRKLQTGQVLELDDIPEAARSPSPEPIYDNNGVRINTREYRAREKLTRERQEIIAEIIKRNPAFKPPADYRPPKLYKKLFIPVKDYPGYNFIGLIIGPRGNTQKRMERETGAKIVIRGKGSIKEGRLQQKRDMKPDPFENEDLHVLIAAETQASLDEAAGMIEKLLLPVDEVRNEHKRAQLKELAALNGTIRDEEFCRICGEQGHRQYECSSRNTTFKSDVLCRICGDGGHPTIDCPLKGSTQGNKMDDEYRNFLAELGGGMDANTKGDVGRQTGPMLALPGPQGSKTPASGGTSGPWSGAMGGEMAGGGNFGNQSSSGGNGFYQGQGTTGVDASNLYVGYLPSTIDDEGLIRMFSPFGKIDYAKVIKERNTGISKGYGFVKYSDPACASQAVQHLNGYRLESKLLAVRVAGKPPPAANPFNNLAGTDALGGGGQWQPPLPPAPSSGAFMGNSMGAPPPWAAPPPYTSYGPPQAPVNTFGAQPMQLGPPSASSAAPFCAPFAGTPSQGAAPPSAPFQGPPVGPLQGPPGIIPPPGSHSTSPAPPFGAPFSATHSQGAMLPSAPFQASSVGPPQGPPGIISGVPQGHSVAGFAPGVPGLSTYSAFSQVPGYYSVLPPASAKMAPPSQLQAVSGCPGSEASGTNIAHVVPQGQQVGGGPGGALPPWATNTNTGVSYLHPQLQQSDAVESEYEKFMSEMAG